MVLQIAVGGSEGVALVWTASTPESALLLFQDLLPNFTQNIDTTEAKLFLYLNSRSQFFDAISRSKNDECSARQKWHIRTRCSF